MAKLILVNAPDRPAFEIGPGTFTMGRLPDNQIVLADALVSRRHAEIKLIDGSYHVEDLNSLNGVYVNNLKISCEQLAHGDIIHVGEGKLMFEDAPAASGKSAPSEAPGQKATMESPPEANKAVVEEVQEGFTGDMPGLGGPEIIKPLSEAGPNFEMEVYSLDEALEPIRDLSVPERSEPARARNFFILYQVARALNSTNSLEELLDQTMTLIFQVINAERGVIFLYDQQGELTPMMSRHKEGGELPKLNVSHSITKRAVEEKAAIITADARYDPRFSAGASIVSYNIRAAICVPLWERGRIRGAVYLDNMMETYAFGEDDLDLLTAIANQVAIAIQQEEMQKRMRENAVFRANLERFHSPDVVGHIMQQSMLDDGFHQYLEQRQVTILFADICNFTPMIERLDPQSAADLLMNYFDEMTEVIFEHQGTVDKFIGDAIMAIFGAPISHENDPELAVKSAIEMLKRLEEFKKSWSGDKQFDIRIGINTGVVAAGYLGSKHRVEYTVLGDAVNVAARLQDVATPGTILVGEDTYQMVSHSFQFIDRGTTRLKGKKSQTKLFEVVV
jgi:adenylate cyclase